MLRIALPGWRAASGASRRLYSRSSGGVLAEEHRQRITEALSSREPLQAYDLLLAYRQRQQEIPNALMEDFFQAVKRLRNPFAVDLFASLVTVDQVGRRHFIANASRVIKLHLAVQNWEQCLQFVRELELANNGDLHLPYDTLEAILVAAKWYQDVDIALQCVQIMQQIHPYVYARTWGMLVQLALDVQNFEVLDWVFDNALKPGYVVLDDASYVRIARLASRHGDLRLCEWAALRMRRRQKAFETPSPTTSLALYICLVEAAARSALVRTNNVQASIRAVSRYLVRLGPAASQVRVAELPQVVEALARSDENREYFRDMLLAVLEDAKMNTEVKVLTYNLLLAGELGRESAGLHHVVELTRLGRAHELPLNEDTVLLLLDVAVKTRAGRDAISQVVLQWPTRRVLKKADYALKEAGLLS